MVFHYGAGRVVMGGVFGSMVLLLEGPPLWAGTVCVCTLFLICIEFHKSFESMAST